MHAKLRSAFLAAALSAAASPSFANVITDWDEKAVAVVTPMSSLGGTSPYLAVRLMGMVHAAMFDAVNSIEQRYRPYLVQLPADPATSKEAAAAAAAATILATIDAKTADEMKAALAAYLAPLPDGAGLHVRRLWPDSGRSGHLRSDLVLGHPAVAGDRHPHGVGRFGGKRHAPGPLSGREAVGYRTCGRARLRIRGGARARARRGCALRVSGDSFDAT